MFLLQNSVKSSRPKVFCKKDVPKTFAKFTGKHLCQSVFFNKVAGHATLLKKETLKQVFSCEFCKISKNTFFHGTPPVFNSLQYRSVMGEPLSTANLRLLFFNNWIGFMLVQLLQKRILNIFVSIFENSYLSLEFSGSATELC